MHKMQEERDQRKKLLQFFMGLNESFTAARGQTLMINPLPSVPQAYSFVKEEERQRMGHNTTQSFTANVKNNSQTSKMQSSVPNNTNDSLTKRATLKCVYCHKEGHVKDNCYKLIGYPPRGRGTRYMLIILILLLQLLSNILWSSWSSKWLRCLNS